MLSMVDCASSHSFAPEPGLLRLNSISFPILANVDFAKSRKSPRANRGQSKCDTMAMETTPVRISSVRAIPVLQASSGWKIPEELTVISVFASRKNEYGKNLPPYMYMQSQTNPNVNN